MVRNGVRTAATISSSHPTLTTAPGVGALYSLHLAVCSLNSGSEGILIEAFSDSGGLKDASVSERVLGVERSSETCTLGSSNLLGRWPAVIGSEECSVLAVGGAIVPGELYQEEEMGWCNCMSNRDSRTEIELERYMQLWD